MRTLFKFVALLLPLFSFCKNVEGDFIKEKTISKTYTTTATATVNVDNSYGNINVFLWNEDKISIQVLIKVSGNNETKVEKRLADIDVSITASQNRVRAITNINGSTWNSNGNLSYEINYIIKIPKNGSVDLTNKYGNIGIEQLNGSSIIDLQYGNLNIGRFENKSNLFDLSYCNNSKIEFIDQLTLSSNYCTINIDKNYAANLSGNYNSFQFQHVGNLNLDGNYTKLKAITMQSFTCDGNYLSLQLGDITATKINTNYSTIELNGTNKTKTITIDCNYSKTKINCESDFAFDFKINTNYGAIKENVGLKFTERSEKTTSKSYSGTSAIAGNSKLLIDSNYGNVTLIEKL